MSSPAERKPRTERNLLPEETAVLAMSAVGIRCMELMEQAATREAKEAIKRTGAKALEDIRRKNLSS